MVGDGTVVDDGLVTDYSLTGIGLFSFWWDLFEEAFPGFLVFAEAFFQIFEDALEVGVGAQVVPRWILLEPGIILIP